MAYIYKIVNDVNNKLYIGKTEFSLEKRFKEHCRDAFRSNSLNRPLYSAMRKYGIENFHIELIEETNEPEEKEKYWIEYYQSFKYGYNATMGGDGKKYLDYQLIFNLYQQIKNGQKVAQLLNISKSSVYHILHNYSLDLTFDYNLAKKPVAKIDLKTGEILEVFDGVKEAEKAIGILGHISQVCNNKRKSCGGFGWKYI